jgi:hypothetical protein
LYILEDVHIGRYLRRLEPVRKVSPLGLSTLHLWDLEIEKHLAGLGRKIRDTSSRCLTVDLQERQQFIRREFTTLDNFIERHA